MKLSCIPHGLALAAALALSSSGAFAASGVLHAMSESEMSDVYGRGIAQPTLTAFGALSATEQGGAYAAASAADALASMNQLSADGAQGLDRQLAQQRLQATASGLQVTTKLAEMVTNTGQILSPIGALAVLSAMPFPLLFTLPSLPATNNKH